MGKRPPRTEDTQHSIAELRRRRPRRRRRLLISAALCLALIAGGIAAGSGISAERTNQSALVESTTTPATSTAHNTTTSQAPPRAAIVSIITTTTAVKRPATTIQKQDTVQALESSLCQNFAEDSGVSGAVVVIDPGHQGPADLSYEPIGPGSSTTKYKMSKGTYGTVTGLPESEVNLAISLRLRDELEARGIVAIMTRTSENVNISNIERAQMANEADARLLIRIHCDAFHNSLTHGIHVLYPACIEGWTDDIYLASRRAAQLAQAALVAATNANDRGLCEREDMTGFNWSNVPVIMPELGFMTNPEEDQLLATPTYQQKLAVALAEATVRFLKGE
ncbi:MAG: N-acetylmuramoyl-L-alanine amidase [Actinobacteria bacterium]|nr:N-acetylmuramoyl-L-alanine amidase [Actinomycetota bacterium]